MLSTKSDWLKHRASEIETNRDALIAEKARLNPVRETWRIIMIYLVIGILWILLSDYFLSLIIVDSARFRALQLYKGWIYVIATGAVFYLILLKRIKLFSKAISHIHEETQVLGAYEHQLDEITTILERQHEVLTHQKTALANSDQRYRLAVEGSNDALWEWDLETGHYHSSILFKPQYHLSEQPPANSLEDWIAILHPEDREMTHSALANFVESSDNLYENTYRIYSDAGEVRWIHSRAVAFRDEKGEAKKIAGSHTDITDSILMNDAMHQEKKLLENVLLKSPVMILMMNPDGQIIRFNPMAERITGYEAPEVIGRDVLELLSIPNELERNRKFIENLLQGEKKDHFDISILCKDGRKADILWYTSVIRDQQGVLKYILSVGVDDTENRVMLDQLHDMAYFDPLTHLPNRSCFRLQAQQQLAETLEQGQKIALVYLDLVNFKHINDSVGVEAGDQLLQVFAVRLKEIFPEPNLISRIGGDEFALLIESSENEDETSMTKRMCSAAEALKFKWVCHEQEFMVSATLGMALFPTHASDLNTLEISADTALFHAKAHDRGKCVLFKDDMRDKILNSIQMSSLLRTALDQNLFSLAYQPILELNTMTVSGVEALIRLNDSYGRPVPPMTFIPYAEQHGYISSISEWVIKTAAKQTSDWRRLGFDGLRMSINLSGKCLTNSAVVSTLQKYVKAYNLNPEAFDLEITETAIIEDLDISLSILDDLKALGFSISLDDFGSGYSSLTYLNKLPIDTLKIDREFISQIQNEEDELHLLNAIIDLAHQLGLRVLAEGVETETQLNYLIRQGCDLAQGYYFCKPVFSEEAERFIASRSFNAEEEISVENIR